MCILVYVQWVLGFEWDEEKARTNVRKHGVRFSETVPVFDDPLALTVVDDESNPMEQRYVTLGLGAKARLLVVTYTYRGEDIRIISARKPEPHELEQYE